MANRIADLAQTHHGLTNFDLEEAWLSSDRLVYGSKRLVNISEISYTKYILLNISYTNNGDAKFMQYRSVR